MSWHGFLGVEKCSLDSAKAFSARTEDTQNTSFLVAFIFLKLI